MEWLVRHGYHAVTERQAFEALEYGASLPVKPVVITFDDGYRDVLWNAAPVLHRLHMPATEFVITGRISGPDSSVLTWPQLFRLERHGVEIGSHTITHADLPALPVADALRELRDSRRALEAHLHRTVQWLAYPYGQTDSAVVALARKAGYVLAMTTERGTLQSGREPLLLKRDEILDTTGVAGLAATLGG
jgi:peptidoglycan/xylan/chitin deacetylase (PgdA/CDA1 family)